MEYTTEREAVSTNTKTKIFKANAELVFVHVAYTSDATVGNRQIVLEMQNAAGQLIMDMHSGVTQAASLVYHHEFMHGIYRETSVIDLSVNVPLPAKMVVPANYRIVVKDDGGVSASDTMVLGWQYKNIS